MRTVITNIYNNNTCTGSSFNYFANKICPVPKIYSEFLELVLINSKDAVRSIINDKKYFCMQDPEKPEGNGVCISLFQLKREGVRPQSLSSEISTNVIHNFKKESFTCTPPVGDQDSICSPIISQVKQPTDLTLKLNLSCLAKPMDSLSIRYQDFIQCPAEESCPLPPTCEIRKPIYGNISEFPTFLPEERTTTENSQTTTDLKIEKTVQNLVNNHSLFPWVAGIVVVAGVSYIAYKYLQAEAPAPTKKIKLTSKFPITKHPIEQKTKSTPPPAWQSALLGIQNVYKTRWNKSINTYNRFFSH